MQQPAASPDFAIPACFLIAERHEEVSLSDCAISVDVSSRVALIEQMQEFHNRSDQLQEVTYAFPDGGDGVVMKMTACLDGQQIELDARKRKEAEKAYEKQREEGNGPVLAVKAGEHVNCLYLGKLAAGARLQVTTTFAVPIKFIGDRGQLRIPTTIAPRYGRNRDPERARAMADPDLLAAHPLRLSVVLRGSMRSLAVDCPSHDLRPAASEDGQRAFECSGAHKDRDIVLHFAGRPPASMGIAASDPFADDGGHVVWLDVEAGKPETAQRSLNVHFLVDCSGSMSGHGSQLAARFLSSFASLISERDTFGISIFGSGRQHLFSGEPGSRIGELKDQLVQAAYKNLGGTDLGNALMSTLEEKHSGADIILVTDGEVHEGSELVQRLHAACRIFAVGIGRAPRAGLLEEIAKATEGSCDFVSAESDSDAVAGSCARLAGSGRRRITDVSWSDGDKPEWSTPLPQTVHADVPLPVAAFFPDEAKVPQEAIVTVDDSSKPLVIAITRDDSRGRELSKLAAVRRHNSISDAAGANLALAYGLMTESVSLVGVIHSDQELTGKSRSTVIRPMLAAGWGGIGLADAPRIAASTTQHASRMKGAPPPASIDPSAAASASPGLPPLPDSRRVSCLAADRSFVVEGMDQVSQYRRRVATGKPLPGRCPRNFLDSVSTNDKLNAMSRLLEQLCRQISGKDKELQALFCQVLEKVVPGKLRARKQRGGKQRGGKFGGDAPKIPNMFDEFDERNGQGAGPVVRAAVHPLPDMAGGNRDSAQQALENLLSLLVSSNITERSWCKDWCGFFSKFVFDSEKGRIHFDFNDWEHGPEESGPAVKNQERSFN